MNDAQQRRRSTGGQLVLAYRPLNWLLLDAQAAYEAYQHDDLTRSAPDPPNSSGGYASRYFEADVFSVTAAVQAVRDFGPIHVQLLSRLFTERREDVSGTVYIIGFDGSEPPFSDIARRRDDIPGYMSSADLHYRDRLFLNALIRRERSEFRDRWESYSRFGIAYLLTGEQWWPVEAVDALRVRAAYGTAGGRPQQPNFGAATLAAYVGNDNLFPSRTTEYEVGLDAAFLDRIGVHATYAASTTEQQFMEFYWSPGRAFLVNDGTLSGRTSELAISGHVIQRRGFDWTLNVVAQQSRRWITRIPGSCITDFAYCDPAYDGDIVGFTFTRSRDQLPVEMASHADEFDTNDDGMLVWVGAGNTWRDGAARNLWGTSKMFGSHTISWGMPLRLIPNDGGFIRPAKIGDTDPDVRFGLTSRLSWNMWQLLVGVDGQIGGDIYNAARQYMYIWRRHADVDQAGKPQDAKKPVEYYARLSDNGFLNDFFVENGTHVDVREIALSCRLEGSASLPARLGLSALTFTVSARNVYTISGYRGYDADIGWQRRGFDNFDYPNLRSLSAGVEAVF
jgi:hypothetical protein